MFKTTICALATARLTCAIHIIRITGEDSFKIINKILNAPIPYEGYKIFHRLILDEDRKVVDDVLINAFVKPKSYTGEDIIEINCHGGVFLADKIIKLLMKYGCELATRGEFTKRAMFNKKLDLSQTEAVNNLIFASNNIALNGSINSLLGKVSGDINNARNELFNLIGQIEVNIDYPEYEDVEEITKNDAKTITKNIIEKLTEILNNSKRFNSIDKGIKIVIFGPPNAGKSTLLNTLTNSDKAIISDIPGTTRDIIEASINLDDITINLFDTAGIRQTDDKLEKMGINKAIELVSKADLVLLLQPVDNIDKNWLNEQLNYLKDKKYIIVYTKQDLLTTNLSLNDKSVLINAKDNKIDNLIKKIKLYFTVDEIMNSDFSVLQSNYQIGLLEKTINVLVEAQNRMDVDSLDLLVEYFNIALDCLNKILGIDCDYDFLDELFAKFCLGK